MKRTTRTLTTLVLCCAFPPVMAADVAAVLPGNASYVLETAATTPFDDRLQRPLEDSIAKGLEQRGWRAQPAGNAQWRIRYELQVHALRAPPDDRSLVPRMICAGEGCRIRQEWVHQGPPLRARPDTRYRQSVLWLTVTEMASGRVAWQGSRIRELPAEGRLPPGPLAKDAERLTTFLPRAPYHQAHQRH